MLNTPRAQNPVDDKVVPLNDITPGSSRKYGALRKNDDKAEKKRRRKSAAEHHRRRSLIGSSQDHPSTPENSNNEASSPKSSQNRRISLAGATTSIPKIPLEVMNTNFEEWIKMTTDNKVNASNSWNFALIDYFHDMSLLREGNSINFQKASCTLDGCMKIYTSRVDSVVTETGKLLSGLSQKKSSDVVEQDDQDLDEEQEEKRRKKRVARSEETLVKDYSTLTLKKFDLEFAVDPLFKKTSADFDEGGARGLLLNHLSIDANCQIIFDASDAMAEGDDDIEHETTDMETDMDEMTDMQTEIERLRGFIPSMGELELRDICPSLKHFTFTSPSSEFDHLLKVKAAENDSDEDDDEDDDFSGENSRGMELFRDPNPVPSAMVNPFQEPNYDAEEPFSAFSLQDNDDNAGLPDLVVDDFDDDDEIRNMTISATPLQPVLTGINNERIPQRSIPEHYDYIMAMTNDDDNLFSYFDNKFMKNWAGPEHWKLNRARATTKSSQSEDNKETSKKKTSNKELFNMDFTNDPDVLDNILLAESTTTSFLLSKAARSNKSKYLFPDDMHLNSKEFMRFFVKQNLTWYAPQGKENKERTDMDTDIQFWADQNISSQQNSTEIGDDKLLDSVAPGYSVAFDGPQGGYDDDDGINEDAVAMPVGDDVDATPGSLIPALTDDTMMITNEVPTLNTNADTITAAVAKFIKPDYVNYARVAKRVDVRKLKENIWKELRLPSNKDQIESLNPINNEENEEDKDLSTDMALVLQGLSHRYPEQKLKDISTSFCFICLLHLANEKGLRISSKVDLDSQTVEHVNALDSLVVFKE